MMTARTVAFVEVACVLGGIREDDAAGIRKFYQETFIGLPEETQALIADFMIAQAGQPDADELRELKRVVDASLAAHGYVAGVDREGTRTEPARK